MLHTYGSPVRVFEHEKGFTLIVGPSSAAQIFGIGVVDGELAPVIVHAMPARAKFLS